MLLLRERREATALAEAPLIEGGAGRHVLVTRVWLLTGIVAVADFVFGATFVVFMQNHGLSATTIGSLLSITAITSILLEAPSGAWGDRHGHKRLVAGGLGLWGFGLVLFSFANGPIQFGAGIAMWAAGLALYSGAAMSLLINTLNADGREHQGDGATRGTETIRWGAASVGAGIVIATAWVLTTQASIMLSGALLLAAAGWVLFWWPDSPSREHVSVWQSLRDGFAFVIAPGKRLLLSFSVLTSVDLAIVILTWQPLALQVVQIGENLLGVALLILSLAVAAGAFVSRWIPPHATGAAVGLTLALLNGSLVLAAFGPTGVVVAVVGAEFFLGVALTVLAVWGQRIFPDRLRATATSLIGTATGLAVAITNGVMGRLWDVRGLQPAIAEAGAVIVGTTAVTVAVALVSSRRDAAHRREPRSPL